MAATNARNGLIPAWLAPGWLQRADSLLVRTAAVNAARAVAEERARRSRWQREAQVVLHEVVPHQRRRSTVVGQAG